MSRAQWLVCGSTVAALGCSGEPTTDPLPVIDATAQGEAAFSQDEAGGAGDAAIEEAHATAGGDTGIKPDGGADVDVSAAGDTGTGPDGAADADASVETDAGPVDGSGDGATDAARITRSPVGRFPCVSAFDSSVGDSSTCDRATQWCFTNHRFEPTGCAPLTTTCEPGSLTDACRAVFTWDAAACGGDNQALAAPHCACMTLTCSQGLCEEDDAGGITVSCGYCYGAPPVRLERLGQSRAAAR
ncbi:MAG: hypothetical protein M3O36_03530, partial [Myxococcota bacterium]|nr:hypothetical protein [Myxococcota bacterium]